MLPGPDIGGGTLQAVRDGTYTQVRTTSVYDPATNLWATKAPMPSVRSASAGRVTLNGQGLIEIVGGARPGNNLQYVP